MARRIQPVRSAADARFAVVTSRFNELITERLVEGARGAIVRHGGDDDKIDVFEVPGSFEIPLVAKKLAAAGEYAAVICVGAVIQGSTSHHEYINSQVASGIMQTMLQTEVPVTFGIITCETMEQALDRAGGKTGNKGEEAALAAIDLVSLLRML